MKTGSPPRAPHVARTWGAAPPGASVKGISLPGKQRRLLAAGEGARPLSEPLTRCKVVHFSGSQPPRPSGWGPREDLRNLRPACAPAQQHVRAGGRSDRSPTGGVGGAPGDVRGAPRKPGFSHELWRDRELALGCRLRHGKGGGLWRRRIFVHVLMLLNRF